MEIIIIILVIINLAIGYNLLFKKKESSLYLEEQADRYFNKLCEYDGSTSGRVSTSGLALIKTGDHTYKFIKQSKLADTSLLY